MAFFQSWLKSRRAVLTAFGLFTVLFFGTFALYRLPLAAVLYPTALCTLLGLVLLAADYGKARQRHKVMTALAALPVEMPDALPPVQGLADADYQKLIAALLEQQRTAEELASAKYRNMTDYYTVWAHQIKTPIAAMRLKLQSQDSPAARQLQNDLNRIEQYANMVLTFLRLESSSTDYVIREYDLDKIVRSAVRHFSGEFIARKLRLDYQELNTAVVTDEKWLSFVVEQVLSNALKYTSAGTVSIYREGQTLCIRDTGIGIAESDLPRIFENGYTGFNGRTDQRASGIGLYLCRRICRNLGHTITAESAPGEGTCIRIGLARPDFDIS